MAKDYCPDGEINDQKLNELMAPVICQVCCDETFSVECVVSKEFCPKLKLALKESQRAVDKYIRGIRRK